jgi:VWFA-related protein
MPGAHYTGRLLLASILLFSTVPGTSGAEQKTFEGTATVVAVEVPLQVTRGGEPVRGLTADNFEVFEGKKKQKIVGFEVVDLADEGEEPAAIRGGGRRHFLFLFDLSFSDAASVLRARTAARRLVDGGLHPTDLAGVATYSASRGADLVLGFTPDRRQLAYALDTLGVVNPAEVVNDPLKIQLADLEKAAAQDRGGGGRGEGGPAALNIDDIMIDNLRDLSAIAGVSNQAIRANQVLALSSSFTQLAQTLDAVPGRKQVVLFSEGFDSSILLGTTDSEEIRRQTEAAASGEYWRVDSDVRFGSGASQSGLLDMLDYFKRADCMIQSVDIGGARAGAEGGSLAAGEDALFVMANHTGGDLYRNYNDLSAAMAEMLERTSLTYILAIEPEGVATDGAWHQLTVKLKKTPRGTRVAHRPGYYAPQPYATRSADERRLSSGNLIAAGVEGGELQTSVFTAPFKNPRGSAYVLTAVEVYGHSLVGTQIPEKLPLEIYAYALDQRGNVRDFFTQAVVLDMPMVARQLQGRGFKFLGHLALSPGDYEVRTLVRNALTGEWGLKVSRVSVPAFDRQASLMPPFFIEPEEMWVLGWEEREDAAAPYPLRLREKRLVPAAEPVILTGYETPLLLVSHNLGAGAVSGSARFVQPNGKVAGSAAIAFRDRFPTDITGVDRFWASFHPPSVKPGRYQLEVSLTDPVSGEALENSVPVYVQ